MGHLAEAGDELVKEYPKHAALVRAERKKLEEDPNYSPDFDGLMDVIDEECTVCELAGNPRSATCETKIESCVLQLKDDPQIDNPYAVCRSAIRCPP